MANEKQVPVSMRSRVTKSVRNDDGTYKDSWDYRMNMVKVKVRKSPRTGDDFITGKIVVNQPIEPGTWLDFALFPLKDKQE